MSDSSLFSAGDAALITDALPLFDPALAFDRDQWGQTVSAEARLAMANYQTLYGMPGLGEHDAVYSTGVIRSSIGGNTPRIVVHYWRQQKQEKRVVFVAHGLFDHVALYLPFIDSLLAQGCSVISADLPGHGLSDGEKASISDFNHYGDFVEQVLACFPANLTQKLAGVGQSTGGAALLNYVLTREHGLNRIERIVLLAPLIRPKSWSVARWLYFFFHRFLSTIPRNFTANTHDSEFCDFLENVDPLQPQRISVQWTGAMKDWINVFPQLKPCDIPLLLIQGDSDNTVDWKRNIELIEAKFSDVSVDVVTGAMHHLVREGGKWRQHVYRAISEFL